MASCSQVNSLFQAYLDAELDPGEKTILEAHLKQCPACQSELAGQNMSAALIFESMADQRLRWSLRSRVLAHLPEMDSALRHGSHPTDPQYSSKKKQRRYPWLLMGAAALVVLGLAIVLRGGTSAPPVPAGPPVGMVTFNDGRGVLRQTPGADDYERVLLKSLVSEDEHYETLNDSRLAMALIGGSMVKLNHGTTVTVAHNRRMTVQHGQAFFDIGRDKRHFYVDTPAGEILVFGTAFLIDAQGSSTTLTVTEGDVLVKNGVGKSAVSRGNQLVFTRGEPLPAPRPVDTAPLVAWADAIVPDPEAMALFLQTLELRGISDASIAAEPIYVVRNLKDRLVEQIKVHWVADGVISGHCGYILHVADSTGKLLLLDSLDGELFDDPNRAHIEIPVNGGLFEDVDVLHIKLIPDYTEGQIEADLGVEVVAR